MPRKDPRDSLAYSKKYYLEHKESVLEKARKRYHGEPTARKRKAPYCAVKNRAAGLKSRYNLTVEQYNLMFEEQKGHCDICGVHQSILQYSLHVDHDHSTGKIRALLCSPCNTGLGIYEKNKQQFELYLLKRGK